MPNKVIVLLDMENVRLSLASRKLELDLHGTRAKILERGDRIVAQVAFADFQFGVYNKHFQRELRNAGFIMIQCPLLANRSTSGKATDDDELMNFVNFLIGSEADFDTVLLGSGDGNFLRAAQLFQNRGKKVCRVNSDLLDCSHDLMKAVHDECDILAVKSTEAETVVIPDATSTDIVAPAVEVPIQVETPAANPSELSREAIIATAVEHYYRTKDGENLAATIRQAAEDHYSGDRNHDLDLATFKVFPRLLDLFDFQARNGRPASFAHCVNVLSGGNSFPPDGSVAHPDSKLTESDTRMILDAMNRVGMFVSGMENDPVTQREVRAIRIDETCLFYRTYEEVVS